VRSFDEPTYAVAGRALRFGVELEGADRGAVLYTRSRTQPSYVAHRLRPSGARYWVVTLAPTTIEAGELQYFVEASDEHGSAVPVVGTQAEPRRVRVEAEPGVAPPSRPPAIARIFTDYADYNRLRGNDWASQTEGDVGVRWRDRGIRAVRAGFGVYRGKGGSVAELDELRLAPRSVGLTYGYLEYEYGFTRITSVIGRGAVGLGDDGATGGAQLALRLGSDQSTNVVIGGEVLGGVGLRGITELNLAVVERFPIMFRTEVTNQPAGVNASASSDATRSRSESDVGLRVLAQVGFRVTPSLTLAARGSYQGRNIEHAGPGFGGGVTYSW
jgi:hypothetical protein